MMSRCSLRRSVLLVMLAGAMGLLTSSLVLTSCGGGGGGAPAGMQPLQPGQPPQKPPEGMFSKVPPVQGGQNPTTPLPFDQPFRLGNMEYQFIGSKGKDFVGLESSPAMRPAEGNIFFVIRYQVINRGPSTVTVPNNAAVKILNVSTNLYVDLDQAATNANIMSGAATGLPDQLVLEPNQPNIQTLVFQMPNVELSKFSIVVADPANQQVFQAVKLSN